MASTSGSSPSGGDPADLGRLPSARDAALCFVVAFSTALAYVLWDREPLFWDEYYHLLAARSWATDGSFGIGDGIYERAAWLSTSVGLLFRWFGESIAVARLAMAGITSAWVLLVFTWVHREAGRAAAWIAALTFGLSPVVLINSTMLRFYGVVGILLCLAAIGLYVLVDRVRDWPRGLALAIGSGLCLLVSYRITPITRLWAVGLMVWLFVAGGVQALRSGRAARLVLPVGVAVVGAVLLQQWTSGALDDLWGVYRAAPAWSLERGGELRWYERMIRSDYPTLWTLFPLAVVLALPRRPRLTSLCLSVFMVGLALLSGAGPKAERYALPILPFFFIVWAIALTELAPVFRSWLTRLLSSSLPSGTPPAIGRAARIAVFGTVVAFVVLTNPGFARLRQLPAGHLTSEDRPARGLGAGPVAWQELAPALREVMEGVDVVVTANALQTFYHVGDFDYEMHPTLIAELSPAEEFSVDHRTGRPVISMLASLEQVVSRHPSGVVFGERWRWGSWWGGFAPDVVDYVRMNMEEVALPRELAVTAYRWGSPAGS
jgi:hypothetical protein